LENHEKGLEAAILSEKRIMKNKKFPSTSTRTIIIHPLLVAGLVITIQSKQDSGGDWSSGA